MSRFQSQSAPFKDAKDADVFPKKMYLALERHHVSLVIHVFGVFGVFERRQRRQRLTLRFADALMFAVGSNLHFHSTSPCVINGIK
jgi:hypothetical protein